MITISLPLDKARALQKATENTPYLLSSAANVFTMLWSLTSSGFSPTEGQLCAVYDFCARALDSAGEKEGHALAIFDMELRDALKDHAEEVSS